MPPFGISCLTLDISLLLNSNSSLVNTGNSGLTESHVTAVSQILLILAKFGLMVLKENWFSGKKENQQGELNHRPTDYESVALPFI